jgi:hypothetical protein
MFKQMITEISMRYTIKLNIFINFVMLCFLGAVIDHDRMVDEFITTVKPVLRGHGTNKKWSFKAG